MKSNCLFLTAITVFAGVTIPFATHAQAQASETCQAFQALGSSSYEVRKTVSSSGVTPGVRNNWDTDFVVPPGTRFVRYIGTITSEVPENFNIMANFRYANQTSRQAFRRDGVRLVGGIPFQIIGEPAPGANQPVLINMNINSRQGTTYRLSVSGCSRQ